MEEGELGERRMDCGEGGWVVGGGRGTGTGMGTGGERGTRTVTVGTVCNVYCTSYVYIFTLVKIAIAARRKWEMDIDLISAEWDPPQSGKMRKDP